MLRNARDFDSDLTIRADSFLSSNDTPYDPAPAPPGPALLDDDESNMLDNFFTTMNSSQFPPDLSQNGQQNKSLGSFNFDWSNELPPTFEGSTTSLSQQGYPQRNFEKPGGGLLPNDGDSNSDILAAASMLYQGGMNENHLNSVLGQPTFQPDAFGLNGNGKGLQTGKESSAGPSQTRKPIGFHTSEMLFDIHEPVPLERQPSKTRPLHWGSDISFMEQGYLAPPDQPNVEQQTEGLLKNMECLEPQTSASNTRAPSPERNWSGPGANDFRSVLQDHLNNGLYSKKRPRTIMKQEDDDEDSDTEFVKPTRRPKGSSFSKGRRASNDSARKSRLQQKGNQPRENLTEEQKRTNHILSEQKRRNLIRQGFDDLCSLVPGLRGGGFSKSAMLTQAADWLEDTMRGNEILKAQLSELKTVNGLVMPR